MIHMDRLGELISFDGTKTGVKGLVDAGITNIPHIFVHEKDKSDELMNNPCNYNIVSEFPIIDLKGLSSNDANLRCEIVRQVKEACQEWGFFQIINHQLPVSVMDEMIQGVKRFHELESEVKKQYYHRDPTKSFQFNSNFDLYKASAATWRDTIVCHTAPHPPHPQDLPDICRDIIFEYSKKVMEVGHTLYELLSEALGLKPSYLKDIGCVDANMIVGHYYPACPEPELTFGIRSHVDLGILTILLQDQIGGLQVLHQNHWVDVPPMVGGLIINAGDFLQLLSNDKFKSVKHRVKSQKVGPRISVGTFLKPYYDVNGDDLHGSPRSYGPIKELLTEEEHAVYSETTYKDFEAIYYTNCEDGTTKLPLFKLCN